MSDKCCDKVRPAWESVRGNLEFWMRHGTSAEDFAASREWQTAPDPEDYENPKDYESDRQAWDDEVTTAEEFEASGDFHEYGLSFDYVEPGTFNDQPEGYWRFQICWGGPSKEIRFYASPSCHGFSLYRAEFWYLDWFDGASVNVTDSSEAQWVWDWFDDVGSVQAALDEATQD